MSMDLKGKRILLTGGAGFLGSHIRERLEQKDVNDIIIPRSAECDLKQWDSCALAVKGVDVVIHAAVVGGGILFNRENPGRILYDNMMMNTQLMEAARLEGVDKFVAVGTVCSYPKFTPVPFQEADLWNGYPEETNAPYGLSKKMMLVQSQAYGQQYSFHGIHMLMVNLYGPRDDFDLKNSHVIPALIRKMVEARDGDEAQVTLWGTGSASREFLFVDDAARAVVMATEAYDSPEPVNIGSGMEITIKDLAEQIRDVVGYDGTIAWDTTKPDGQPRRCLDVSRAKERFDFTAETGFREGLEKTLKWYESHRAQ